MDLDVPRLVALMRRRDWSAQQLHLAAGEPSKRTINRWLAKALKKSGGKVRAQMSAIASVADALGVRPESLVVGARLDADIGVYRFLMLAASLGPRVYLPLIRRFGVRVTVDRVNRTGRWLSQAPADSPADCRFERWSMCENLLREGAALSPAQAKRALTWLEVLGLDVDAAPESHCLCAIALRRKDEAVVAGRAWMEHARRHGYLAEVRWVGERLLDLRGVPAAARREIALGTAEAMRWIGRLEDALRLLTDVTLDAPDRLAPDLEARLALELAQLRYAKGDIGAAIAETRRAEGVLAELEDTPLARALRTQAVMERLYFEESRGYVDAAARSLEALESLATSAPQEALSRFYRQLGVAAIDRGDVETALRHFHVGVDIALARADAREAGLGHMNLGITYSLAGDDGRAEDYFSEAVLNFDTAEAGPFTMGLVQLNYAEHELFRIRSEAARRRVRIAIDSLEHAGYHPSLLARCHMILSEAAALDGRYELAYQLGRVAYRHAVEGSSTIDQAMALAVCAAATNSPGRCAPLAASARRAMASLPEGRFTVARLEVERHLATAYHRCGDIDRGRAVLDALASAASASGATGIALRARRSLSPRRGTERPS